MSFCGGTIDMRVIVIAAQKGGVGKSTLAQCLAVEALKEGRRAAIVDMDPQQSVVRWGARRLANGILVPAVVPAAEKAIRTVVNGLRDQGAAVVVIDTPPLVTPQLNAALEIAEGVVLVTRPNPMDLDALLETWAITQRLKKMASAIITQAPPAAQRARALKLSMGRLEKVGVPTCPSVLSYTLSYPYAQAEALTVQEREPSGKARAEMAEVWAWLKRTGVIG
jgi:chromosome partitioning protein